VSSAGASPERLLKSDSLDSDSMISGDIHPHTKPLYEKIIEVHFKWGGTGYMQVSIHH
jgi:hypothetical protein